MAHLSLCCQITPRLGIRAWLLLLCAAYLGLTSIVRAGNAVELRRQNPFSQLAGMVAESGIAERQDFAWIAVSEVINAYEKALQESGREMPTRPEARVKLARWRRGTRDFSRQLYPLLDYLRLAPDIQIQVGGVGPTVLFIGNHPVVISGPEISSARQMEGRIIDTYCGLHDCPELLLTSQTPATVLPHVGRGSWVLANRQPVRYETPDGLSFVFSNLTARDDKQRACERIARELRTLTTGLSDAQRAGYRIEWERVAIRSLPGRSGSHVQFNGEGDYLLLDLPLLEQAALLDGGALAWVESRMRGKEARKRFTRMERLLSEHGLIAAPRPGRPGSG